MPSRKAVSLITPRTVAEYLAGKPAGMARLFRIFEGMVAACGPAQVEVHRTDVYWRRGRVFCGAFILTSKRLELAIYLRRTAHHAALFSAFPVTSTVIAHRLSVGSEAELDGDLLALLREAYETAGPGTRPARRP